jgi:hypothetical protein
MSKGDKDKVIRGVYYDADTGFGSINDTYQQAKNILNTITYNDVKQYMDKLNNRQVVFTYKNIIHTCHRIFRRNASRPCRLY